MCRALLQILEGVMLKKGLMKVLLKIRCRGKRGYDVSSVPFKKLEKMSTFHKLRWELKYDWLILEAF
jgi:hypothetical protein